VPTWMGWKSLDVAIVMRVCFGGLLVVCYSCSIKSTFIQQFTEVDDIAVCQNDGIAKMRTKSTVLLSHASGRVSGDPEPDR
jgi:hypothetical protein